VTVRPDPSHWSNRCGRLAPAGRSVRRGQLVLVAAGVIALALLAMLLAYLQLGYAADVRAADDYDAPARNAERVLERAVHGASVDPGNYSWGQRDDAADEVRSRLEPRLETLRASRVEEGVVYRVRYNRSAASAHASEACPSGPDRRFGPCEADGGVVLQRRAGETHLLAVAFDLTVTTPDGEISETVVVQAVGGIERGPGSAISEDGPSRPDTHASAGTDDPDTRNFSPNTR